MRGLNFGLLLRTPVLQSKAALLVCLPPFLILLLYLALPLLECSLMPKIWHALHGVLEGPASAFLLLNGVAVTIIASSKMGSKRGGREEESQGQFVLRVGKEGDEEEDIAERVLEQPSLNLDTPLEVGQGKGMGDDAAASVTPSLHLDTPLQDGYEKWDEVVERAVGPSLHLDTPIKNGPDLRLKKGENFPRRSWSLNARFDVYKPRYEQVQLIHVLKERKPMIRRASRKDDKAMFPSNKPLSNELRKTQLISSSYAADSEGTRQEMPTLENNNFHRPQARDPAPAGAAEHPSMDEVWAAITSSKKGGDRLQPQLAAAANTGSPTQAAAAALALPAAAMLAQLAPATAKVNLLKEAKAAPNFTAKAAVAAAAAKKSVKGGNAEEYCGELEKLNRRAEKFIGRFNYQVRLQREESLQRRKGACRPRDLHDVPHSTHLPAGGLLVG